MDVKEKFPILENPSSFEIDSSDELLKTFRPRDRKNVIIPKSIRFPVSIGHYLTWAEPSGIRIYLVFKKSEWKSAVGISFRKDQQGSSHSNPGVCEWCHSHGPSDQIGLLTVSVDSKRRRGISLCLDLSCLQKLENIAKLTGKDLNQMAKALSSQMARFCKEGLGLELETEDS